MISVGPIEKLGTVWWFEFFDLPEEKLQEVSSEITKTMTQFENDYSRFKPDSVLSQLNKNKIYLNPNAEFLAMIQWAVDAYGQTQGVFNIAVGDYLVKSGYDQDYSFQSQETMLIPRLDSVLQYDQKTIRLLPDTQIDFGGLGKGYLIDKLAGILKDQFGLQYYLINGGGDMYVTSDHGEPIEIGLQDPETKQIIGKTKLHNQAFASSSPILRQWADQQGDLHSHLVGDGDKQTVYLTAPNATHADIWATTLAIDGGITTPSSIAIITQ